MNKDNITKKLFEDKEVFASFINDVIYQGKKILSSRHLKEIKPWISDYKLHVFE
ncbi:hypothetical protein [uncultured Faecalicoccus sp.]|uniref:hypothetical protein n=1 Tax=uncultured Faecalicoccus sp. TaxID=1971760 RepID=UPI00258E8F94|nr:hypothetical protein [uncultured Faecalicoccus sp.]